jgi:hypothetical protein
MTHYREPSPTPVLIATVGSTVVGVDAASGTALWKHALGDPAGTATLTLLVTPTFILAAGGALLACMRYPGGELLWTVPKRNGRAALLLHGDRVYASSDGEVESFTLTGQRLWGTNFDAWPERKVFLGMARLVAIGAIGFPGNVAQADENS